MAFIHARRGTTTTPQAGCESKSPRTSRIRDVYHHSNPDTSGRVWRPLNHALGLQVYDDGYFPE